MVLLTVVKTHAKVTPVDHLHVSVMVNPFSLVLSHGAMAVPMRVIQVSTPICTLSPVGSSRPLLMPVSQSLEVPSLLVFKLLPCLILPFQLVPLQIKHLALSTPFSIVFPIWVLQAMISSVRPLKKHQRLTSQRLSVALSLMSMSTHGKFASWLAVASVVEQLFPTDGFLLLLIVVMVQAQLLHWVAVEAPPTKCARLA